MKYIWKNFGLFLVQVFFSFDSFGNKIEQCHNCLPFHVATLETATATDVQQNVFRIAEGSVVGFDGKRIPKAVVVTDDKGTLTDGLGLDAREAVGKWLRGCAGGVSCRGIAEGPLDGGQGEG